MAENKQPDITQEMRDLAIQNIAQARAAYNQLMEAAHKTQEMMKAITPSNPIAAGITEAQERRRIAADERVPLIETIASLDGVWDDDLYLDLVHFTKKGNERIASAMFEGLLAVLGEEDGPNFEA